MNIKLINLLKICIDTINDHTLEKIEREECFRIMEAIINIMHTENNNTVPDLDVLELIVKELDILHPLSFLSVNSVTFFIVKSWVTL